jgi:prephenate dehydrogenase/prephenate dehydratase
MDVDTVGVIGYGRFGRFWAGLLSRSHRVLVNDRQDLVGVAAGQGVQFVPDVVSLCAQVRVIFLCVPISQLEPVAIALGKFLRPGTLVLDTCSVKTYAAQVLQTHLGGLPDVELIATHPMFGPDSGAQGLAGLTMVMWPLRASDATYHEWHAYFAERGLNVVEMPPDQHDRLAANSQGVTHYMGRVLGEMDLRPTPIDTQGFKILLSVIEQTCNDTWQLFHDLQAYNPYTADMRLQFEEAFKRVYSRLLPVKVSTDELVVGIQGGRGSFNEEACRHYCGEKGIAPYRIEFLYTSLNVLAALYQGRVDRGVFAIQNARGGVVYETIEALSRYSCEILDYFDIVVSHCILHHPEVSFDRIDTLISHPQALAQCQHTLRERYPGLKLVSGEGNLVDQALCAECIAEGQLPRTTAVLASRVCADLYGLTIHDCDLQDLGKDNLTTFVWVQRRQYFR